MLFLRDDDESSVYMMLLNEASSGWLAAYMYLYLLLSPVLTGRILYSKSLK